MSAAVPTDQAPAAATITALDAAALRRLLTRALRADQAADVHIADCDEPPCETGIIVPAAVLVPFVLGPVPGVLLTRRGEHLSVHGGQVSFPGGRIDPGDAGPEAAALREAQEEIALDPARVEILGRLGDYVTGTGYRITPVLGLLPPGLALDALSLRPSPDEVAAVFELPLSVLLDPAAPQLRQAKQGGRLRSWWVWPHPQQHIWGATAAILVNLAARLRGAAQAGA